MNKLTKTFLITTTLLVTAGTAVAVADSGHGNHDHHVGISHSISHGMGTGKNMMGQHLHKKKQMGLFNQIPDLTTKQREQLSQLQAKQQKKIQEIHNTKIVQRKEMKSKIDTILTADQRKAYAQIHQHKPGHHVKAKAFNLN